MELDDGVPVPRVELSDEVEEFGVLRPVVTFDYADNEHAMREDVHRIGRRILDAAGGTDVVICEGNDHTMDGCRVGDDFATSVVDRDLRYDHPNLYVCDASVFVTSGGARLSQTIQAPATRLAHHLGGPPR